MKITKKRIAIATAAAALATVGIFGGTYAKYNTETLATTDNARLAKFYLNSDNTLDLFKTEYDNENGSTGADVKSDDGDKLIAPNAASSQELEFTVATEVKSKLTFSYINLEVNLPSELYGVVKISIGDDEYTLTELSNKLGSDSFTPYVIEASIPAGTPATTYKVPVTFEWDFESGIDDEETAAAIAQAQDPSVGYYVTVKGNATLTQID